MTALTTPASNEFSNLLRLFEAAVVAGIDLIQIREKNLSAGVLFHLATAAARITTGSSTKLLINDRSDIAAAAGADGVHLTTQSLPAAVVRRIFGDKLLIGVSTHSAQEASEADRDGADFAVFGPVFETASKSKYGPAQGVKALANVCREVAPFPIFALGGVTIDNVEACVGAGAQGIAGITVFGDPAKLVETVNAIRKAVRKKPLE